MSNEQGGIFTTAVNDAFVGSNKERKNDPTSLPPLSKTNNETAKQNNNQSLKSEVLEKLNGAENNSQSENSNEELNNNPDLVENSELTDDDRELIENNNDGDNTCDEIKVVDDDFNDEQNKQNESLGESSRSEIDEQSQKTQKRKPPSRNLTYRQTQELIPEEIRNNPHVARRLNTFPHSDAKPPRAACSDSTAYHQHREVVLDEVATAYFDGEEPEEQPTVEELKHSALLLRAYERELTAKSDYKRAKMAAIAFDKVNSLAKKASHVADSSSIIIDLLRRRDGILETMEQQITDYEANAERTADIFAGKAASMGDRHQDELDKFDENIPTSLGPQFSRNSVTYFKMRSEEKHLAMNRQYDDALKKKAQADKLQRLEEQLNYEKQNDYYNQKKMRLLEKQNREIVALKQRGDADLDVQRRRIYSRLLPNQDRVDKLNIQIEKILESKGLTGAQFGYERRRCERLEELKPPTEKKPTYPKTAKNRTKSAQAGRNPQIRKPNVATSKM